ncbi:AMP-binding protein [Aquipuribacter nitratireducens]|uniref:AMP-binding protein n=1 Tax=Aquipuribacter nitratireducens TaxID=650104 RepID=A0ABW0GMQ7_9MICO
MSGRAVLTVPVTGADGRPLLDPLRDALCGAGPAVLPRAGTAPVPPWLIEPLAADEDDPRDPTAALVTTTGSTGAPRAVLLPASALLASAAATHDHLGGSGRWLLAVPAHTVAGVMVLVRSLVAGTTPVALDLTDGFDPARFAAAAETLGGRQRRYTSLVPTQLRRLLVAPGRAGREARAALVSFDAVLVGGAALDAGTRERAEALGVGVVETYGMTETCGGCVYDGTALPGVRVDVEPPLGRVVVSGPVVARGYRRDPAAPGGDHGAPDAAGGGFGDDVVPGGPRCFRTTDRAVVEGGRLRVLGRLDDVVVCGGTNVALDAVAAAARTVPGVTDALAVGLPDDSWGTVVGLVLVPDDDGATREVMPRAVTAVRDRVGRAATPHRVVLVDALPVAGVGKPDRAAAVRLLAAAGAAPRTTPDAGMGDHGRQDHAPPEQEDEHP